VRDAAVQLFRQGASFLQTAAEAAPEGRPHWRLVLAGVLVRRTEDGVRGTDVMSREREDRIFGSVSCLLSVVSCLVVDG
jgi:hypothetical protein